MTQPIGFWSYARDDDGHMGGRLSELRQRLSGEIAMLLGHPVGIFQDINDLRTGDKWEQELRKAIAEAAFMIPVLTPSYFNSKWCREETLAFLRLAGESGKEPKIFPIVVIEDFNPDPDCEVREALSQFQNMDFSQWRFDSDPTSRAKLENKFGKDIVKQLARVVKPKPKPKLKSPSPKTLKASKAVEAEQPEPPKEDFPTLIVDAMGRGDYTTISEAIEEAPAGAQIRVRPGAYRESLHVSKPLELRGDGPRDRVIVTTDKGNALLCDAPMAKISGLTLRREPGGKEYAVWITGGGAEIEDCVVESESLAVVGIVNRGTAPLLRRCVAIGGSKGGFFIYAGAKPILEDCEAIGSELSGFEIKDAGTAPVLNRCIAREGKSCGFYFQNYAGGKMEHCTSIGNTTSGIVIKEAAQPIVKNCVITGNGYKAVWILDAESGGTFVENDLRNNADGAWDIADGAKENFVRRGNKEK
ncbi:MAG: TIR domain-containing protein [Rhodobacteraceae bacterium]|nr:TIR domain-containing protein [Paracoccaceae bacterium]